VTAETETKPKAKNWYIVHTYSGFEERVRQNLKQRVEAMGMAEHFGEIRIPT
jgi:transcription termination/antitermination protein NusG